MSTLHIQTKKRSEFIDITRDIQKAVNSQKINEGICVVFCPHTTAGLTINENADPCVKKDIISHLEELVPEDKPYSHSEGNSDSHIKSSLVGSSLNIIIENNQLVLGTWQGIYFCEFDGPRSRNVFIKAIGG
ncbi:MAG: YjbQ family protein [Candidatus Omnitrophota bacterium]|nr:MAG: YjbQ family protein [Candidatus Omnitrophota bacterium]